MDQHEASTPDPGADRVRHRDGELHGDRGIYRIATTTQNRSTDLGSLGLRRGHGTALEGGCGHRAAHPGKNKRKNEANGGDKHASAHRTDAP